MGIPVFPRSASCHCFTQCFCTLFEFARFNNLEAYLTDLLFYLILLRFLNRHHKNHLATLHILVKPYNFYFVHHCNDKWICIVNPSPGPKALRAPEICRHLSPLVGPVRDYHRENWKRTFKKKTMSNITNKEKNMINVQTPI